MDSTWNHLMMNSHVQIHIYEFIFSINSLNMNIFSPLSIKVTSMGTTCHHHGACTARVDHDDDNDSHCCIKRMTHGSCASWWNVAVPVCYASVATIDLPVVIVLIAIWVSLWYTQCPHKALVAFVGKAALWLQGKLPQPSLSCLRGPSCERVGASQWLCWLHPWIGDCSNSLTPIGPYLAHRLSWALFKVNNFLIFCLLTTFNSSKRSWAFQLELCCFTFVCSLLHWWRQQRVHFRSQNCLAFLRRSTVRKLGR